MTTMTQIAVWPGTIAEYARLLAAAEHNCQCQDGYICQSHLMLSDQDRLNHLAFEARMADRLWREEFTRQ